MVEVLPSKNPELRSELLFYCCAKIPNRNCLRKEVFMWPHSLREPPIMVRKLWKQEPGAAGYCSVSEEKDSNEFCCLSCFPF